MVFSSLRSRNRHSANPNPRLHTGAGRDNVHNHRNTQADLHAIINSETQRHKDKSSHRNVHNAHTRMCKEIGNTIWQQDDDANTRVRTLALRDGLNGQTKPQHGCRDKTPPNSPSDLHPQAPPPPPPLLPACTAPSLGCSRSLLPPVVPTLEKTNHCRHLLNLHSNHATPAPIATANSQPVSPDYDVMACTSPLTNQQRRRDSSDPVPKKKPRKSSMPVKIEREKAEEEEGRHVFTCV